MKKLLILIGLTMLIAGCLNNDDPLPRLENIWPNEDGLVWLYDYSVATYPEWGLDVFEDIQDVPNVPPMDVLAAYLDNAPSVEGIHNYGVYELWFDGEDSTLSGAWGQRLVESLYGLEFQHPVSSSYVPTQGDRFLQRLALARPELRPSIQEYSPKTPLPTSPQELLERPFLIAGGIWDRTDEYIGNYLDFDQELAWWYLSEDLTPGDGFTKQLAPHLAEDLYLDVLVMDWFTLETPVGTFERCVPVLYRVDLGLGELRSDLGQVIGYSRTMIYGVIYYVPEIGPVYAFERNLCNPLDPLDCAFEIESSIVSHYLRD
jgi:hypothetical protein